MPCGHPASPDPEPSDGTGRSPPDADLGLRFFSVRGLFERDSGSSPRPLREPEDRVGVVDCPGPRFPEQPPLCGGRVSSISYPPVFSRTESHLSVPSFSFCDVALFVAPSPNWSADITDGRSHAHAGLARAAGSAAALLEPQWLQAVTYHTWHSTAHNNCAPDIAGRVKAGAIACATFKLQTTCACGCTRLCYSKDLPCCRYGAGAVPTAPHRLLVTRRAVQLEGTRLLETSYGILCGRQRQLFNAGPKPCASGIPTAWESYGRGGISPARIRLRSSLTLSTERASHSMVLLAEHPSVSPHHSRHFSKARDSAV